MRVAIESVQTTSTALSLTWTIQADIFPDIQTYQLVVYIQALSLTYLVILPSNTTTYDRADLEPSLLLNISVTASNLLGESEEVFLTEWTKPDTPSKPLNLVATKSPTTGAVVINWDQPEKLNGKIGMKTSH